MQVRSCRFRLLGCTPALQFRGRRSWVQLSRASINNARREAVTLSPLPPSPSGAASPEATGVVERVLSQGLAQADHRHLEPQGLSKSLSLQFLHLQVGLTQCLPLCKGPVCKELRHSQIFTKRAHFAELCRDTGWLGPGPAGLEWCRDTGRLCLAVPLCQPACSASGRLGSACCRVQPWDCSLRPVLDSAPA